MTPDPTLNENVAELIELLRAAGRLEPELSRAATMVSTALREGRKLLACGNGGSAADALHLTTEFVCRYHHDRRGYPAICLNGSGSDLTAIGNDYGFDELFSRQVVAFGLPGDVLVAFTTSGKSANVERALHAARGGGVRTIAFLGRDGGVCKGLADVELHAGGSLSARIQEVHKVLLHTLCEVVDRQLGVVPPAARP